MELDLTPFKKNLETTDARLKKLRERTDEDLDDDGPSEEDLTKARSKLIKEIAAREVEILRLKVDRYPTDMAHRLALGDRLLHAGKVEEAIKELQQVRRDEKHKGRALMFLGAGFRKLKKWPLAQRNFEEALAALPASDESARKEVLYQLATGSAENGDLARRWTWGTNWPTSTSRTRTSAPCSTSGRRSCNRRSPV